MFLILDKIDLFLYDLSASHKEERMQALTLFVNHHVVFLSVVDGKQTPRGALCWCVNQMLSYSTRWAIGHTNETHLVSHMIQSEFPQSDPRQAIEFSGASVGVLCQLFDYVDLMYKSSSRRIKYPLEKKQLHLILNNQEKTVVFVFYVDDDMETNLAIVSSEEQGKALLLYPWLSGEQRHRLQHLFFRLPKFTEEKFPVLIRGSIVPDLAMGYIFQLETFGDAPLA